MKLKDKIALVTGGSSGIGEATAVRFAAEGASVAVVGSSDLAKAESVAEKIRGAGGTAKAFVADVTDVAAIRKMVADVKAEFGRIDVLVNSAGVFYQTALGDTTEADYDRTMDVNVKGTFFTIDAVAPIMKEQGGGKIINLSSVLGVMGMGTYSVYCASKAAVNYMTKATAIELAPHNIRVNAILPGNTATPMNLAIRTQPEYAQLLEFMAGRTPSNRTYSEPEEMASAAVFMASDDSPGMYGALLVLDEGFSLGM